MQSRGKKVTVFRSPCGFTLIEILVAIGIIGILVGLLMVAIQSSRESARRLECQNNLKQFGIAINQYAAQKKYFPKSYPSLITTLAPFLELENEVYYQSTTKVVDGEFVETIVPETEVKWHSILVCPSDFGLRIGYEDSWSTSIHSRVSYYGCTGALPVGKKAFDGIFSFTSSRAVVPKKVRVSQVKDGHSNTVAMSEGLRGGHQQDRQQIRTLWDPFLYENRVFDESDYDQLIEICRNIPVDAQAKGWQGSQVRGTEWHPPSLGGVGMTLYNHILPPNNPSCTNGGLYGTAISTATSDHSGNGVNVVFADGHVQFIYAEIEESVWRALATRSSKDTVSHSQ